MTPGTLIKHCILVLLSSCAIAAAQTSTTLVSVTRTTTVHVTATDYGEDACANFYGACVVYGKGNAAGYTTTVYQYAPTSAVAEPSTPVVTATTTFLATITASNSGACQNYNGACVVYGPEYGAASSTVYYAGSNGDDSNAGLGNGQGYIAAQGGGGGVDGGDGQIGGTAGATALKRCTYEALIGLGLAVGVAALLI